MASRADFLSLTFFSRLYFTYDTSDRVRGLLKCNGGCSAFGHNPSFPEPIELQVQGKLGSSTSNRFNIRRDAASGSNLPNGFFTNPVTLGSFYHGPHECAAASKNTISSSGVFEIFGEAKDFFAPRYITSSCKTSMNEDVTTLRYTLWKKTFPLWEPVFPQVAECQLPKIKRVPTIFVFPFPVVDVYNAIMAERSKAADLSSVSRK